MCTTFITAQFLLYLVVLFQWMYTYIYKGPPFTKGAMYDDDSDENVCIFQQKQSLLVYLNHLEG